MSHAPTSTRVLVLTQRPSCAAFVLDCVDRPQYREEWKKAKLAQGLPEVGRCGSNR